MKTVWRRYLFVGLLAVGVDLLLPVGLGRDLGCSLIAASGAAALYESVRRNRPDHPSAWRVLAGGMAFWAVGMALYSWHKHANPIATFPSLADVAYLAAYPLIAGALLMFARSRGRERRPTALLDSAIVTLGVGLLSWVFLIQPMVFLIQPIWAADGQPTLSRLVALAYPLGNVLLFGALARLANAPGPGRTVSRLLAASIGGMLVVQSLAQAVASVPIPDTHSSAVDPAWVVFFRAGRCCRPAPVDARTVLACRRCRGHHACGPHRAARGGDDDRPGHPCGRVGRWSPAGRVDRHRCLRPHDAAHPRPHDPDGAPVAGASGVAGSARGH